MISFITLAISNNCCDLLNNFLVDFGSKGECVMVSFVILCSKKWSLQYLPSIAVSKSSGCFAALWPKCVLNSKPFSLEMTHVKLNL